MPPLVAQLLEITMLNFAPNQIKTNTLLRNSNELAKFTPAGPTNNAIQINAKGIIQVYTKESTIDELSDLLDSLALNSDKNTSFAQEKMILIWHFSQLLPYLKHRLDQLRSMPIDTLQQYHDNSMQLQGFYQLCRNSILQLAAFNQLISDLENPQKQYWTSHFNLLQQYLSKDLAKVVTSAQDFISQIISARKNKLTVNVDEIQFHQHGPIIQLVPATRAMPIKYPLGKVRIGEQRYEAKAYFQTYRNTWDKPEHFQFTGKMNISISNGEEEFHAFLLAFPSWDDEKPTEKDQTELDAATNCAHNKLKTHYIANPTGAIKLEPVTLCASFVNMCPHVTSSKMLPYLVTLVNLAKSNNISDVILFAPYNYSAIMYAYGFYPRHSDKHSPTVDEQKQAVDSSHAIGIEVPFMNQRFNRQTAEGNTPILRAFCFDLSWINSRPVFLTDKNVITTYCTLLKESDSLNPSGNEPILPEILQIPLKFTGAMFSLKKREMTGKFVRPAVTYGIRTVNYQTLDDNSQLPNYAFSDPVAAKKSFYQKMLTLNKKML